ncbi:MAG: V-type ATP synthase subunit I [Lachnospiraceae bacterium]|nr:V-type ATP synthase subunit I [Lachnospiraceae bacterium]
MKKLKLIAVSSQREEILKDLLLLGCVQIDEPKEAEEARKDPQAQKASPLIALRSQKSTLTNALARLNKYAPDKKGLLDPLPEAGIDAFLEEGAIARDLEIAQFILDNDVKIRSIQAQENREQAVIASMKPWLEMNQDLGQSTTKTCEIIYGTIPASENIENAKALLADLDADITVISEDKQFRFVNVVYYKGQAEEVGNALRPASFSAIAMTGLSGTPKEITKAAENSLVELAKSREEHSAAIAAQAEHRQDLKMGLETLQTVIDREETKEKSLETKSTFRMEGWITAPEEEKLAEVLGKYTCAWETEDPDPAKPEEVPVKLRNNRLTRPYNVVTEMYSLPAYNGLDPNPFIMPFFALFFGIMFADMAYGLLMFIAGMVWSRKAKPKGTMGYMAGLLIECGISTFIMGFLINGFFGDLVTVVGSWFGKDIQLVPNFASIPLPAGMTLTLPLNLLEGNNPLIVLIGAICLGGIHLFVGVCIGCYLKIRDGQWIDAIFNDFSWWVIIAGIGVFALAGNKIVLIIGFAMMILGSILTNKGFGKITGIVSGLYNGATGYLGDFLSYSRLMALMLAGSVIASVFNQLGSLGNANGPTIPGTILFVAVFLIGHVLNFLLNIIGCFVHTLRLQYLEFFGKWYRDGGKAFRPLGIKPKYFDIATEENTTH